MSETRVAVSDPRLGARIVCTEPLFYRDGPSADLDRPAHVRAASGLAKVGGTLVIVQDDASFVALREEDGGIDAIALPPRGGRRRFEARLGNKLDKLDLESCVTIGERVIAFGSGSTEAREQIAIIDPRAKSARLRDAAELYRALRNETRFAGEELNVEGAVVVGSWLRLFQRGNGKAGAVNASIDVELEGFLCWLDADGALPARQRLVRYDLGRNQGVAYGFTDATVLSDGRVVFVAGAEDSPNVIEDGVVLGARIGIIEPDSVRFAPLHDADGASSTAKVEGIEPSHASHLHAVTDRDDPDAPALLCDIELTGPW